MLAEEIGADNVLLIDHYGFPMFKFMWFPYTMVRSHFRVPLKTALNRENEMIAPNARKGSESLLTQGEET